MKNTLAIIVPCYNEEEVLNETNQKLTNILDNLKKQKKINKESFILYVNDGSSDKTWNLIEQIVKKEKYVYGVSLSRNRGHQNALLAGISTAVELCDMSVTIDADLQDDVEVIEEMVDKYNGGVDIVYGVRDDRTTDSFFKRFTAESFYKFMNFMEVKSIYNHADFRLMSKRSMEELLKYQEVNLFLRALVPLIGYKYDVVYYKRKKRLAGKSKYPLSKMLKFALDGITSFSTKPISLICSLGVIIIICSIIAIIYAFIGYFNGKNITGWSSLFCSIWLLGGIQILSIGIIGQYIGKTYLEVKKRPRFNIDKFIKE